MPNFWEAYLADYYAEVDQDNDNATYQSQANGTAVIGGGDVEDINVTNIQANATEQSNDADVDVDGGFGPFGALFPARTSIRTTTTHDQTQANPTVILGFGDVRRRCDQRPVEHDRAVERPRLSTSGLSHLERHRLRQWRSTLSSSLSSLPSRSPGGHLSKPACLGSSGRVPRSRDEEAPSRPAARLSSPFELVAKGKLRRELPKGRHRRIFVRRRSRRMRPEPRRAGQRPRTSPISPLVFPTGAPGARGGPAPKDLSAVARIGNGLRRLR